MSPKLFDKRFKLYLDAFIKYGSHKCIYDYLLSELNKLEPYKKKIERKREKQIIAQQIYLYNKSQEEKAFNKFNAFIQKQTKGFSNRLIDQKK